MPVRLRVSAPDGTAFAPLGRVVDFATGRNEDVGGQLKLGQERWYSIDGGCEIRLPAGMPLRIQAMRGPEYRPLDETITLGPGQMALRFSIERWSEVAKDNWTAGDSRSHFLPPHSAALEGAAEGLAVVNVLACVQPFPSLDGTAYTTIPNLLAFSGQDPALDVHGCIVAVNTLNTHPVLGRLGLLHAHRPVYPLTFGGFEDTDDWSLCDWCDQCRRKQGLTIWTDPFRGDAGMLGGEALAAVVLGKLDAVELDGRARPQPVLPWIYRMWNAAFPIPLVGGSGKDSNRTPLGAMRTYAQIRDGEAPTNARWVEAVRAGRTVVTNGPMLSLEASGHGPGATLDYPTDEGPIRVLATARSPHSFEKLELVASGKVIASASPVFANGLHTASLSLLHQPTGGGWLAARCWAASGSMLDPAATTLAHSSPIWFRPPQGVVPVLASAIPPLRQALEQARAWVAEQGRFLSEKRKQQLLGHFDRALARIATSEAANSLGFSG